MRAGPLLILLLGATAAASEGPQVPRSQRITAGLLAPDRAARETAETLAREWARTDPAGVDALFKDLDVRGRVALVRALAGAGTSHGARLALAHAADPDAAIFRAIVAGLGAGGRRAIFAKPPRGLQLAPERQRALADLRLRWEVESRFAALKSRSGRTGHFAGQYKDLAKLGPAAIDVVWYIVRDRAWPQPGEASGDRYRPVQPALLELEEDERRELAAYAFGEIVDKNDSVWKQRIKVLFAEYWRADKDLLPVEKLELAPALAYSLHDLGLDRPAKIYINRLRRKAAYRDFDGLQAMWDLGYAYMRIGEFDKGESWYRQVIELQNDWGRGIACYNLACYFAVRSLKEPANARYYRHRALQWLESAILQHNFIDWVWMEEDGDLNALREEPRYKQLRERLKAKYPEPPRRRRKIEKDPTKFLKPKDEKK